MSAALVIAWDCCNSWVSFRATACVIRNVPVMLRQRQLSLLSVTLWVLLSKTSKRDVYKHQTIRQGAFCCVPDHRAVSRSRVLKEKLSEQRFHCASRAGGQFGKARPGDVVFIPTSEFSSRYHDCAHVCVCVLDPHPKRVHPWGSPCTFRPPGRQVLQSCRTHRATGHGVFGCLLPKLGPPVLPFDPFFGEGSPAKIDYKKEVVSLF